MQILTISGSRVMQRKIDPEALPDVQTHTAWASPWGGVSATAVRWAV